MYYSKLFENKAAHDKGYQGMIPVPILALLPKELSSQSTSPQEKNSSLADS